ncbi:hypothetical protein KCU62_g228, partial [Aureobasidium sp. EXF-3399]
LVTFREIFAPLIEAVAQTASISKSPPNGQINVSMIPGSSPRDRRSRFWRLMFSLRALLLAICVATCGSSLPFLLLEVLSKEEAEYSGDAEVGFMYFSWPCVSILPDSHHDDFCRKVGLHTWPPGSPYKYADGNAPAASNRCGDRYALSNKDCLHVQDMQRRQACSHGDLQCLLYTGLGVIGSFLSLSITRFGISRDGTDLWKTMNPFSAVTMVFVCSAAIRSLRARLKEDRNYSWGGNDTDILELGNHSVKFIGYRRKHDVDEGATDGRS